MSRKSINRRAPDLLAWLLKNNGDSTSATLDLLREIQDGFDVSNLRALLRSPRPEAVAAGIWIASELGVEARPLFDDIASLISHPSPRVRFFALDCFAACLTPSDAKALVTALDRMEDSDAEVRWKALVVVTGLSDSLIVAARREAAHGVAQLSHIRGMDLLLRVRSGAAEQVLDAIRSGDSLLRAYAAIAAARMVSIDPQPLRDVANCPDKTMARFAQDMAERARLASSDEE